MKEKQFRENCMRTAAGDYLAIRERLNGRGRGLTASLATVIRADMQLDGLKKFLYYGKQPEGVEATHGASVCSEKCPCSACRNDIDLKNIPDYQIDLLHAALGKVTEAAEFYEEVAGAILAGRRIDLVNLTEEIGDGHWYDALAVDSINRARSIMFFEEKRGFWGRVSDFLRGMSGWQRGVTFPKIWATVIRKLRDRYPEKFTEKRATNRDLEKERKTLEGIAK